MHPPVTAVSQKEHKSHHQLDGHEESVVHCGGHSHVPYQGVDPHRVPHQSDGQNAVHEELVPDCEGPHYTGVRKDPQEVPHQAGGAGGWDDLQAGQLPVQHNVQACVRVVTGKMSSSVPCHVQHRVGTDQGVPRDSHYQPLYQGVQDGWHEHLYDCRAVGVVPHHPVKGGGLVHGDVVHNHQQQPQVRAQPLSQRHSNGHHQEGLTYGAASGAEYEGKFDKFEVQQSHSDLRVVVGEISIPYIVQVGINSVSHFLEHKEFTITVTVVFTVEMSTITEFQQDFDMENAVQVLEVPVHLGGDHDQLASIHKGCLQGSLHLHFTVVHDEDLDPLLDAAVGDTHQTTRAGLQHQHVADLDEHCSLHLRQGAHEEDLHPLQDAEGDSNQSVAGQLPCRCGGSSYLEYQHSGEYIFTPEMK